MVKTIDAILGILLDSIVTCQALTLLLIWWTVIGVPWRIELFNLIISE